MLSNKEIALRKCLIYIKDILDNWSRESLSDNFSCWNWTGTKTDEGYARLYVTANRDHFEFRVARIVAHIVYNLDLSNKDKYALHRCNNRACINPLHIYVGDHFQNMKDMSNSGLNRKPHYGARHPHAHPRMKNKFCKRGHEMDENNTYIHIDALGKVTTQCKTCRKERSKKNA